MSASAVDRADVRPRPVAAAALSARLFGAHSPTLLLSLSLNLLLLAFFVVLNTGVDFDRGRVRAALDSVRETFGRLEPAARDGAGAARAAAEDALRVAVSAAFAPVLDGVDVVVRTEAGRVVVRAPFAAVFEPATGALRPALPLLDRVAAVLAAPPDGLRTEMLVALTSSDAGAALAQAGALADDVMRRGVDPALFAVGAVAGPAPAVVFTFAVFAADEPALAPLIGGPRP